MASTPKGVPAVAIRGSTGISLNLGPPNYDLITTFTRDDSKTCKVMLFSPEGKYFAWANSLMVKIVSTSNWKPVCEIPQPKVHNLAFSPKGTYLLTWEPFMTTPSNPAGNDNLNIWKADTGELVHSVIHKKQEGWEPQWTLDEGVCARWVNNEVVFHEDGDFQKVVQRSHLQRVVTFALSPTESSSQAFILFYVPGKQGQPSFGKLYHYGKLDPNSLVASKSFFQADKVDMFWNSKGTNVLLMTSMEVDKTGASYYGKQALHSLSTKGETAMVMLGKEGPIHSVVWSPSGNEFCVIYGLMPAKATLFNLKCEPVFDFGSGARNSIYYSPSGSLLLLGGFGNLPGKVEIWDVRGGGGKNPRKIVAKLDAPDTTLLQWSPDCMHFVTATTAPRLRVGNGFKIWHFTGSLLYERPWNKQEELWEVCWQTYPLGTFQEQLVFKPVEGIAPSQPQVSKQVYRPPNARGTSSNFRLHEDEEPATGASKDGNISKAALKMKKKREAKKAKKESSTTNGGDPATPDPTSSAPPAKPPPSTAIHFPVDVIPPEVAGDPEKVKKIKNLRRKLDAIQKLKEQKESGKTLELNQLEKINKEAELIQELEDLIL